MPQRPAIIVLTVVLAFGARAARGQLEVSFSPSPPDSGDVILAFDTASDLGSYPWTHGSATEMAIGQTFRFDAPVTLEGVTLVVTPETDVAGELVAFTFGAFGGPEDVSMNELLFFDGSYLPLSLVVGETVYLELHFPGIALEAGRQYGFHLAFEGGGNVNDARARVRNLGGDLYSGGRAFHHHGSIDEPLLADLAFYLQGDGPVADGEDWMWTPAIPDFRFRVRITSPVGEVSEVRQEQPCIPETLCVGGAMPGRSEVFVRIVGPKPNGYLWPTIVKFTTSQVEIWIEQTSTGDERYYLLAGACPGVDTLPGLFDRTGFEP